MTKRRRPRVLREKFIGPMERCCFEGCPNPCRRHLLREGVSTYSGLNRYCATHISRLFRAKHLGSELPVDAPIAPYMGGKPKRTECKYCGRPRDMSLMAVMCKPCFLAYHRERARRKIRQERLLDQLDDLRAALAEVRA